MTDGEINNSDDTTRQTHDIPSTGEKRQPRGLLIVLVVFIGLVTMVFLTQSRESSINWVEDYQAGIELAKQRNKPVLFSFFKQNTRFCTDIWQNTYNNPDVIKYVGDNFVPVLIDVDKQPEIAERYRIGYYPTHYIKRPGSDELFGPRLGYDPPALFIEELKKLLEKMNASE